MLPTGARLRRRQDFAGVMRHRKRVVRDTVIVHYASRGGEAPVAGASPRTARIGLIVSRRVGGAVVRNRIKRRLRALAAAHLQHLPPHLDLVLRAQPLSTEVAPGRTAEDVTSALSEIARRVGASS